MSSSLKVNLWIVSTCRLSDGVRRSPEKFRTSSWWSPSRQCSSTPVSFGQGFSFGPRFLSKEQCDIIGTSPYSPDQTLWHHWNIPILSWPNNVTSLEHPHTLLTKQRDIIGTSPYSPDQTMWHHWNIPILSWPKMWHHWNIPILSWPNNVTSLEHPHTLLTKQYDIIGTSPYSAGQTMWHHWIIPILSWPNCSWFYLFSRINHHWRAAPYWWHWHH